MLEREPGEKLMPRRIRDARGVELTASSPQAGERYEQALELLAGYYLDPLATIDAALAEDPDFVSGHCLRAGLGVIATERGAEPLLRESLASGARLAAHASERERRHFAAAQAWLDGDFQRAMALYGAIVLDHPRDQLALQIAHIGDFALGQQRMLRDRVVAALAAWEPGIPGYSYVLGMLAFGLEETNLFDRAETTARDALARNPRDPWAVHALAHVFEMTGRIRDGIELLESGRSDWAARNSLAYHNFWHLALYHIEEADYERAMALFDEHIWPRPSAVALEMIDAASLLFRLHLRGLSLGARAASVADAWSDPAQRGYYAFSDVHAVMAMLADHRLVEARAILAELERRAGDVDSNAHMVRTVALPLSRALIAFEEERYPLVIEILIHLRCIANQFGGSNAQREVIEQVLGEAAVRAGSATVVRALAAERRLLRPQSGWARSLLARI
jgi:tetratricopeptide (TPR) repeat protein